MKFDCTSSRESVLEKKGDSMHGTLLLIHDYHPDALGGDWEYVMWGNPQEGVYGRIACALMHIPHVAPALILLGSALSKDESTLELMLRQAPKLDQFTNWAGKGVEEYLRSVSHVNSSASTTIEELRCAAELCKKMELRKLVLISSPTHIARCLNEALKLQSKGLFAGVTITAMASSVSTAGTSLDEVVIIEPPHRGDTASVPFYKIAQRLIPFIKGPGPQARKLYDALDAVLTRFEKKL